MVQWFEPWMLTVIIALMMGVVAVMYASVGHAGA